MKIMLLLVGDFSRHETAAMAADYQNRIKRYLPIDIKTIKPEKVKSLSDAEILKREGERILDKLSQGDKIIVMDKAGKMHSSKQVAAAFEKMALRGQRNLVFVIGGPLGLDEAVKQRADEMWSFSKMTFPHELAAVMLLKQLYRDQSIRPGEKYHK